MKPPACPLCASNTVVTASYERCVRADLRLDQPCPAFRIRRNRRAEVERAWNDRRQVVYQRRANGAPDDTGARIAWTPNVAFGDSDDVLLARGVGNFPFGKGKRERDEEAAA